MTTDYDNNYDDNNQMNDRADHDGDNDDDLMMDDDHNPRPIQTMRIMMIMTKIDYEP